LHCACCWNFSQTWKRVSMKGTTTTSNKVSAYFFMDSPP
jgi:hypothetical protein